MGPAPPPQPASAAANARAANESGRERKILPSGIVTLSQSIRKLNSHRMTELERSS
jgi:hypothetical protein